MADAVKLGSKVRALRRQQKLTQVELARRLDISTSYLNLIEHNQRALTADLLIKVAQELHVDLQSFAGRSDERLTADLLEAFSDPLFDGHSLTSADLREVAEASPSFGRAVLALYQAFRSARDLNDTLAARVYEDQATPGMAHSRLASEEVNDFIQQRMNWFPELEQAAEDLWQRARLQPDELYDGLLQHLRAAHGVEVRIVHGGSRPVPLRRYDPGRQLLHLSEVLPPHSRCFQVAAQLGLLEHGDLLARLADDPRLTSADARTLGRAVLANWFAAAVLMPYQPFLEATRQERYDVDVLGNRFGASFEQVCHRLTTLRRPGAEGVPLHLVRVDLAGNLSKNFSASGIRFARFSGACPRWNIHAAFLTPGHVRTQLSTMPDGTTFFCIARTVTKGRAGHHAPHTLQALGLGCHVRHARELVYADGIDLERLETAVPVGVTCRLCERTDCEQRALPSLRHELEIDVNVRRPSPYMGGLRRD